MEIVMNLSAEQIQAIKEGKPVRVAAPEVGEDVLLVRASALDQMREALEDEQEKAAWANLARKARDA